MSRADEVTNLPERPDSQWNDRLGDSVNNLANRIDSYFGEIRADDERSGSTLRVSPQMLISEFQTPQPSLDMRLNLKLKNLEELGQDISNKLLYWDKKDDGSGTGRAGFGYSEDRQWEWSRNLESHAGGISPTNYGALLRIRKNFKGDDWIHRYWWATGWSSDVLWQTQMNFSSDYALAKDLLFRWVNQWTFNMSSSLQNTSHGPSLFQTISDRLSVSYDARVNYAFEAGQVVLNDYSLGAAIRRRLKGKWIFLEVDPSVDFGRTYFFQRQLSILGKVEFAFGNI